MIDLMFAIALENRRTLQTTVLYRNNGVWSGNEVGLLVNGLTTEACQHPKHPEYVILWGHHTKTTLKALVGGADYTVTQVTGADNDLLPFRTAFT